MSTYKDKIALHWAAITKSEYFIIISRRYSYNIRSI